MPRRATALAALLCACAATPEAGGPAATSAEVRKLEIPEQDFTRFTAVAHVVVPEASTIEAASWELLLRDEKIASGTTPVGAARGEGEVVEVRASAPYAPEDRLAEVLEATEPLPLLFRGTLDAEGGRQYGFSVYGKVRSPRVPEISIWHIEAAAYHDSREINLVFFPRIKNANPFDVRIERIDYTLHVDGRTMIEDGVTGKAERVPASSTAQLEIPLTLGEANFPEVGKYLKGGRGLRYRIEGEVQLGLGRIPFEIEGPIELGKSAPSEG